MGIMETYKIDLLSNDLKGKTFEWDVNDDFFASIDGLIQRGNIHATVECMSAGSIFKFLIHSVGTVIVPCDRCLADLELRIDTADELAVKLGSDYSDDGDCVVVPEAEGYLDLAQFIYEFIVLSMPITCQHEPGKCDDAMMHTLSEHQAARSGQEDGEDEGLDVSADGNGSTDASDRPVDERWAALAKLKLQN